MRALCLPLVAAVGLAGCSTLPEDLERPPPPAPTFEAGAPAENDLFESALWDDGNAEVARFVAHQMRYGEMREGELVLITVKESFDPERLVKADGPHHQHVVDAIKSNTLLTFQTGVYTYRQMVSVFLTRTELRPMKLAMSSQEWCGTTSAIFTVRGDEGLLRAFSYFGDQAEVVAPLSLPEDLVFEDALPVWLRALDADTGGTRRIDLVPSQLSNRAVPPEPLIAEVDIGAPQTVEVPEGTFEARPITVSFGDRRDVYHVDVEEPHAIVRFSRGESTYERTLLARAPYWTMHGTEHDLLLLPDTDTEEEVEESDAEMQVDVDVEAETEEGPAEALNPESPAPR